MSLLDTLRVAGVEYRTHGSHHHVSETFVGVDCPDCSPGSGHFRLGFSLITGACSCYVCGRMPAAATLAEVAGIPHAEAREILGDRGLVAARRAGGKLVLPAGVGPMTPAHREYLRGRGFDPDGLERLWNLQGTRQQPELPWRIFVPIHSGGEVVSWTTRTLKDSGKRYHSASPEQERVRHKSLLYGLDRCINAAIICEGPADVWRVGPGAVATFGLKYTDTQVALLSRLQRRVICFDSSPEAQAAARRLASDLAVFDGRTFVVELDAADPGSAAVDEINRLRRMLG